MNNTHFFVLIMSLAAPGPFARADQPNSLGMVFERVRGHEFHPTKGGTTLDRGLNKPGVASLADDDWKVRTLAVRDMVRAGAEAEPALIEALQDDHVQVRYLSAMALGIRRSAAAAPSLEEALRKDREVTIRSQAAAALGQIGRKSSLPALRAVMQQETSGDVLHQSLMAIHGIEQNQPATPELAEALASLDEASFGIAKVGEAAPDFTLPDTAGQRWRLSDFKGKQNVLLVWVFADWCPVCLVDRASAVGVQYAVQPMAFAVHAEYINRPTAAFVDMDGVLRFLYHGTYWGDRPSVSDLLEMARSGNYVFDAPKRLKPKTP